MWEVLGWVLVIGLAVLFMAIVIAVCILIVNVVLKEIKPSKQDQTVKILKSVDFTRLM